MRPVISYLLLAFLLSITSCLEKIDLAVDKGFRETISISGKMSKGDPSRVLVRVSRLFDFVPDSRRTIFAKEVLIRDEYGHALPLKISASETYSLDIPADHPEFRVDHYERFQLEVQLPDGRRYLSEYEQLLPVPRMDTIRPLLNSKLLADLVNEYSPKDFVEFYLASPIRVDQQETNTRFRWDFEATIEITSLQVIDKDSIQTCYVTQKVDLFKPRSFDGTTLQSDRVEDLLLTDDIVDWRFAEGYVFHTYQESLTKTAFAYWKNVEESVLRSGDMFEAASGKLQTNFSNPDNPNDNVAGFFYATEIDTFHLFIDPQFAGSPPLLCYPRPPFPPDICIDCLSEPRSSGIRPSYFPQ